MNPDFEYEDERERHWEGEVHRSHDGAFQFRRTRREDLEFSLARHIHVLHERAIALIPNDLLRQMTLVSLDQAAELRKMVYG